MDTIDKRLYEGMFLVDPALASSDWEGISNAVKSMLDKAGAEVVSLEKWDERKLAYEINGKSRGTYILSYFNAEPARVNGIEKSVQLSEQIMRVLVLRAEHLPGQRAQAGGKAVAKTTSSREKASSEGPNPAAGHEKRDAKQPAQAGPDKRGGVK